MTSPGERRDPDVERKVGYPVWPESKPFPLTPLEAWYVLQGWAVKPKAGLTLDQALDLPGKVEFGDGYVWLWQS
jgi:hypothetical protein